MVVSESPSTPKSNEALPPQTPITSSASRLPNSISTGFLRVVMNNYNNTAEGS